MQAQFPMLWHQKTRISLYFAILFSVNQTHYASLVESLFLLVLRCFGTLLSTYSLWHTGSSFEESRALTIFNCVFQACSIRRTLFTPECELP
ncbi:hypothetical protein BDR07DRAFT_388791 [Suillus spraguei]|nr:hypothetical protein BDR07DRAFT_388791 [Suillus spraguei]